MYIWRIMSSSHASFIWISEIAMPVMTPPVPRGEGGLNRTVSAQAEMPTHNSMPGGVA